MSIKQRVSRLETTIGKKDPYGYISLLSDEELEARLRALHLKAGADSSLPLEEMV